MQRHAPEVEKRARWYQGHRSGSRRVAETYVRVGGRRTYLLWAVNKRDQLIDSMLSHRRDTKAAYRFLRNAIETMSNDPQSSLTTYKLASYAKGSGACIGMT